MGTYTCIQFYVYEYILHGVPVVLYLCAPKCVCTIIELKVYLLVYAHKYKLYTIYT